MVLTGIKKILPNPIKHPLLSCSGWYWYRRGLPAQSARDIWVFKEVLSTAEAERLRVFEWGPGASTIYYSKFLNSIGRRFEWYAIDNSRKWFRRVEERITRSRLTDQVHIYCSEFPAFWEMPEYSPDNPVPPQSYSSSASVLKYVNFPKELAGRFDVIILDGRYRRRCLLVAAEVLAPRGIVILHDAHRTHYHSSLSVYSHVQFLETGVLPGTRTRSAIALCSTTKVGGTSFPTTWTPGFPASCRWGAGGGASLKRLSS